jgi:putative endonuclease
MTRVEVRDFGSGKEEIHGGIRLCLYTREIRIRQHKEKKDPTCHSARYNINKLVYFERFTTITAAIAHEKQLKGWLRIRKLELIISTYPAWLDLSADLGKPIQPYSWPERA